MPCAVGPYQLVTGRFDGDAFLDFAVVETGAWDTGAGGNLLSVYLGKGDGTFQPRADYATGAYPVGIASGDLNGDGAPDLIAVNRRPAGGLSWLSVFLNKNDASGQFHPEQQVATGRQPMHVAVGFLNPDAHADLAVAVHGDDKIQILIGNGDGTFNEPLPRIAAGNGVTGILITDLDADGIQDVAATNWFDANLCILLGNGDGSFTEALPRPATGSRCWNLAAGDFNRDGKTDLAVPSALAATMSILLGNGDGTFQPQTNFDMGASAYDLAVTDLDRDGRLDLITAAAGVRLFMGLGDGTFVTPPQILPSTPNAHPCPAVADFNHDSAMDVVFTNQADNTVAVSLQTLPPPGPRGTFFALPPQTAGSPMTGSYQGNAVAVAGDLTAVGAPQDAHGAPNSGVVRVYDARNGNLLHFIPNPVSGSWGEFGRCVALSGHLLAVGAPLTDVGGLMHAGVAHVFDLAAAKPAEPVLTVNHPSPSMTGFFGTSIAISGDWLAVGCTSTRSVTVFNLAGTTPGTPVANLTDTGSGFGRALAAAGNRLIIGADNAVWVHEFGTGATLSALANPTPDPGDDFGRSVAIFGDRVVVGDPGDDTRGANAGCAHFYDLAGPSPGTATGTVFKPDAHANDLLGFSVAVSGSTVVVTAPYADTWGEQSGSVVVFDDTLAPAGGALVIHNPEPSAYDLFGWAAAISGPRLIVGVPAGDAGASDAGCAYAYDLTRADPVVPVATLDRGIPPTGGRTGQAVAVTGTRVITGAPDDDTGATHSGKAWIHDLAAASPTLAAMSIPNPEPAADDHFGEALAVSGNLLAVGVPDDDTGAENSGAVRVFDLASATPAVPVFTLGNPTPAAGDRFGAVLAIEGDWIVVTAPGDDTGGTDAGSVYIHDLGGGTPDTPLLTLNEADRLPPGCRFGVALAMAGSKVVVSARPAAEYPDQGFVFVYDPASATPAEPWIELTRPPLGYGGFGVAVSASGDFIAVGSPPGQDQPRGLVALYDLSRMFSPEDPFALLEGPDADYMQEEGRFGTSVAIHGRRVVVGSPFEGVSAGLWYDSEVRIYDIFGETDNYQIELTAVLANPRPLAENLGMSPPGGRFGGAVAVGGKVVAAGAPLDDALTEDAGISYAFVRPQIFVSGGPNPFPGGVDYGSLAPGASLDWNLDVVNTGGEEVTLTGIQVSGGQAQDFVIHPPGSLVVPVESMIQFSTIFTPSAPGLRETTLSIGLDDIFGSVYQTTLRGTGLSTADDTDGDGLNDVAEFWLSPLGFFWNYAQPQAVETLFRNAGLAGFYQESAVRALRVPPPALQRDPLTGKVTLTTRLEWSPDFGSYGPFPAFESGVSVTGGVVEFDFGMPDETKVFSIETR